MQGIPISHTEKSVKWTAWLGIDSACTEEWVEFAAFSRMCYAGIKFPWASAVIKTQAEGISSIGCRWSSLCHGCGLVEKGRNVAFNGTLGFTTEVLPPILASNSNLLMKWCQSPYQVCCPTHYSTRCTAPVHLLLLNLDGDEFIAISGLFKDRKKYGWIMCCREMNFWCFRRWIYR